MKRDEIEKLLGGYATGTLTDEEREALFRAALEDQELFNALADEHGLKELLDEPGARRRLLGALEPKKAWIMRPVSWAAAGAVAVAVLAFVIVRHTSAPPAEVTQIAMRTEPMKQAAEKPAAAPAPPRIEERKARAKAEAQETKKKVLPRRSPAANVPVEAPAAAPARAQLAKEREADVLAAAAPKPEGLRHTLLLTEPDGTFRLIEPDALRPGDVLRLTVRPDASGSLKVVLRAPGSEEQVLLESAVEKGRTYQTRPFWAGAGTIVLTLSGPGPVVVEIPLKIKPE